jgi:hypothetical protein
MNRDYVHVGVYVECINPESKSPVMRRRCERQNCLIYYEPTSTLFCGNCGAPTVEYQAGTESFPTINPWEIEIEEALFVPPNILLPGVDIWLPNLSGFNTYFETNNYWEVTDLPQIERVRASHMHNFEVHFSAALEGLRAAYGPANVTVKWGIVRYSG